ncbi:MAG: 50S ribosomal protein L15 [Dehalococcoidia bacterium]|nr:50S ribosomal protein L15 [Dehalococcoidia bacterium]MDZ4246285.1 50S ribosomal protein L15 [Dehalococcoidia bacterium]
MVRQHELKPAADSKFRRKRVGRGDGSGHGAYSGKGMKGQKSRSGGGVRPGFEGGQNPLIKKLPFKRGFTNHFKKEYSLVNIGLLNVFESGSEVTPDRLLKAGLVKSLRKHIKVLGNGTIEHPLVVHAHKFSNSARTALEAVGGKGVELKE